MSCLLTHKNTHRAATQCFLLSAVCKLGDPVRIDGWMDE